MRLHKLLVLIYFLFPIAVKAQQVVEFEDKGTKITYTPYVQKCEVGSRLAIEDYGDWMIQGCKTTFVTPGASYEVWDGKVEEIQKVLSDKRTLSIKVSTYAEGVLLNQNDSLFAVPANKSALNLNNAKPSFVNKKEFSGDIVVKETFIDSDNSTSISYYNSNEALIKSEEFDSKNVLIKRFVYGAISTEYNSKAPNQISCGVGLAEIKEFTVEVKDGKTTGKTSLADLTVAIGKTPQSFDCYSAKVNTKLIALNEALVLEKEIAKLNAALLAPQKTLASYENARDHFSEGSVMYMVYDGQAKKLSDQLAPSLSKLNADRQKLGALNQKAK